MPHFHEWDYAEGNKVRVCHKCGKTQYVHAIREAPEGWAGYSKAHFEWRSYKPTEGNTP